VARRPRRRKRELGQLIDSLPDELARKALTHSSWIDERADSYGRLAFLGDSVLGLGVASELFDRFGREDIGRLTKIQNQAVSGRACAEVAEALGLETRLHEAGADAPESGIEVDVLLSSERAVSSIVEALIGACYIAYGYERTATAVVRAFGPQIDFAAETSIDFKSELQELLAQRGSRVSYEVTEAAGPAHDRRFEVAARIDEEVAGTGSGRSKKAAEQAAAEQALERVRRG
jgi:ribonuclease III